MNVKFHTYHVFGLLILIISCIMGVKGRDVRIEHSELVVVMMLLFLLVTAWRNQQKIDEIANRLTNVAKDVVGEHKFLNSLYEMWRETLNELEAVKPDGKRPSPTEKEISAWAILKGQYSYNQIATITGRPVGTIKAHLHAHRNRQE